MIFKRAASTLAIPFQALVLMSFLTSCASMELRRIPDEVAEELSPPVLEKKVTETDSELEKSTETPLLPKGKTESDLAQHPALLVQMNKQVEFWIRHFTTRGKRSFEESLRRGNPFRKGIEKTLQESGIPVEFYFLSLIESGFATHAVSHAGAVGFWQFMPGTAKRYGLQTARGYDERRDPLRSTRAAATYLRDLYNVFGSWRLAMAAYNAGEYRILSAIMRGKTRDFWNLVEKKMLPKETMHYVPKFYAAAIVAKNPGKYGLSLPNEPESSPKVALVDVPSPVSLGSLADVTGISHGELRTLNPHLQKGFTPYGVNRYGVWVPEKNVFAVKKKQSKIASLALQARRSKRRVVARAKTHTVRRGESLTAIAKKYGTTVATLKRANSLRSGRIRIGQKLSLAKKAATTRKQSVAKLRRKYKVRPGDTLASISARFGLPIAKLRSINELSGSRIYSGQLLRL